MYDRCTDAESCPGVYYAAQAEEKEICVSPAVCRNTYRWYPYSYGKERKCLKQKPFSLEKFDVNDGIYSCKAGTYIKDI